MSIKVYNMQKTKFLTENWAMMEEDGKVYMAEVILHNDQGKVKFEFKPISKRYDEIYSFDMNGVAKTRNDDLYGLIYKDGTEICKPQYIRIRGCCSAFYSTYNLGGKAVSIDRDGKVKWL